MKAKATCSFTSAVAKDQLALKPGDWAIVTRDDERDEIRKVRSEPWQLGHGEWMIKLEGVSGGFMLSRCRPAAKDGERTIEILGTTLRVPDSSLFYQQGHHKDWYAVVGGGGLSVSQHEPAFAAIAAMEWLRIAGEDGLPEHDASHAKSMHADWADLYVRKVKSK